MDEKKRMVLICAIAATILVGVISGFGLPLFFQSPDITIPGLTGENSGLDGSEEDEGDGYLPLQITPENVQDVVATLKRQEQYYRELKVERYWGSVDNRKSALYTSLVWNDGSYSKTAVMSADGSLQNCLIADGRAYVWYSGDRTWFSYDAEQEDADQIQKIPTYEDVLDLDKREIVQTDYDGKRNAIFIEAEVRELSYLERFWVSVESGLLIAAETVRQEDGVVLYSMSEKLISGLQEEDAVFSLPDGTVLHRAIVSETEEEDQAQD